MIKTQALSRLKETSANLESYIKVAAESVKTLRKSDVYRVVMESTPKKDRQKVADYIKAQRPDLEDEVEDCLNEE